jgi:hypothetical protein
MYIKMDDVQDDRFAGGGTPIAGLIKTQQQQDPRMQPQQQQDPRMQPQQQQDPRMQPQQQQDPRMQPQYQQDPRMQPQYQQDPRMIPRQQMNNPGYPQLKHNRDNTVPLNEKKPKDFSEKFESFSKISLMKIAVLIALIILFNSPMIYEFEKTIISPNAPFGGMSAVIMNALIIIILFIIANKFLC